MSLDRTLPTSPRHDAPLRGVAPDAPQADGFAALLGAVDAPSRDRGSAARHREDLGRRDDDLHGREHAARDHARPARPQRAAAGHDHVGRPPADRAVVKGRVQADAQHPAAVADSAVPVAPSTPAALLIPLVPSPPVPVESAAAAPDAAALSGVSGTPAGPAAVVTAAAAAPGAVTQAPTAPVAAAPVTVAPAAPAAAAPATVAPATVTPAVPVAAAPVAVAPTAPGAPDPIADGPTVAATDSAGTAPAAAPAQAPAAPAQDAPAVADAPVQPGQPAAGGRPGGAGDSAGHPASEQAAPVVAPVVAAAVAQAPPAAQPAAPAVGLPAAHDAVQLYQAPRAVAQLLHVAVDRGIAHAKLNLRPVELGGIEIRLQTSAAGVTAQVVADSPEAAKLLQQAADDLRRSLERSDITLLALDIGTADDERFAGSAGAAADFADAQSRHHGRPAATAAAEPAEEQAPAATTIQLPDGLLVDVLA